MWMVYTVYADSKMVVKPEKQLDVLALMVFIFFTRSSDH